MNLADTAPAGVTSATSASPEAAPPSRRRNVLVILCDDLGFGDIDALGGGPRAGRPQIGTPRLNQMASDGLVLRGLYCPAPVCAPSRASLLSGVTQGHCELRDNAFDQALEDAPTLASVARAGGYATVAIGKWGLQGETGDQPAQWPGFPTRRGFDHFYGYAAHTDGHEHYPHEGLYRGAKQVWDDNREVSADLAGCYTTDLFTARAKQWIIDHRQGAPEQPFLMYLAFDTPHAVIELPTGPYPSGTGLGGGLRWLGDPGRMISTADGVPDSWEHPDFADSGWPEVYRRYATSVRRIDDAVGDLLDLLSDLSIDDQTVVLFTSDNGPSDESYLAEPLAADFFTSSGPFDGIKRDCWEGGVRVGGIVRAPGLVAPGGVSEHPAQFHDLLPTVCDLVGVPIPARSDGVSLMPLLTGRPDHQPASTIYVEYWSPRRTPNYPTFAPSHRGRVRGQMQVIRLGDLLGVRYNIARHADPFEIYDVLRDPQQVTDLADDLPELQERMHAAVLQNRVPHPTVRRPYDDEPIPPGELTDHDPGRLRAFRGEFEWVPRLDGLAASDGGAEVPDALIYDGELEVGHDAICQVSAPADVAVVVRVHEARVLDTERTPAGEPSSGRLILAAGRHPFRVWVRGAQLPTLDWTMTPVAPATSQTPQ